MGEKLPVVKPKNAIRALEKAGLTLEGRLVDKEQYKGRYWDVLLYGIVGPEP